MALINCPECGSSTSEQAKQCIKCGYPISRTTPQPTERCNEAVRQTETPAVPYEPKSNVQTVVVNERKSNPTGTAGFVLSLIALIFSWVPGVGWIIWFLGFLLSFIGMFKSPKGLAVTGFLLSLIDLIILIVVIGGIASIFAIF